MLLFLSGACSPAIIPQAADALPPFLPRPCVKPLHMESLSILPQMDLTLSQFTGLFSGGLVAQCLCLGKFFELL